MKIQYEPDAASVLEELLLERLPPPHRQMFDTVVSLLYAIDQKFTPPPKDAAPEFFVPTMTWYEGEALHENRKTDGRTVWENELRYVNGQWRHIFYKERSYDVIEGKIYLTLEDVVYAVLSNFVQVRAYWIVNGDPAFKKIQGITFATR